MGTQTGVRLDTEQNAHPLDISPALLLWSELRMLSDVVNHNPSNTTQETNRIEPATLCACTGVDVSSDRITRGAVTGVSVAAVTTEQSVS
jgi:hypothetical protein